MTLWIFRRTSARWACGSGGARHRRGGVSGGSIPRSALPRALTAALSQTEAVPKAWILCGNGAADLIFRLALAEKPKHALVLAPTFAEYAAALETVDCEIHRHMLREENDFALTDDVLNAIEPPIDRVFLLPAEQPDGSGREQDAHAADSGEVRGRRRAAGSGRVLPRLSAGWRSMDDEAGAGGAPRSVYFKGVYKALRHGGRSAGLRSLRRRGFACADAARGSAVGRFVFGADRLDWRRLGRRNMSRRSGR